LQAPSKTDYVNSYLTLYEGFGQGQKEHFHRCHPFDYETKCLVMFLTMMMIRRITAFKAQHRWLKHHSDEVRLLGFEKVPDRTILSRQYRRLYPTIQAFIAYLGLWAEGLSPEFDSQVLIEDASLSKRKVQFGINRIERPTMFPKNCVI
jgi:hypothetical protein